MDLIETIKKQWGNHKTHYHPKESVVFIPLIQQHDRYVLLYEVRSYALRHQPGDVCFPGGHRDAGETRKQACIREVCEELQVDKKQIHILGNMDPIEGRGMVIYPFIGLIEDYRDTYSTDEVDHIFKVPVDFLLKNVPQNYSVTTTTIPEDHFPFELIPGGKDYKWMSKTDNILFYLFQEEVIWGITARITHTFILSIKQNEEI